jgi:hypothetical protein
MQEHLEVISSIALGLGLAMAPRSTDLINEGRRFL